MTRPGVILADRQGGLWPTLNLSPPYNSPGQSFWWKPDYNFWVGQPIQKLLLIGLTKYVPTYSSVIQTAQNNEMKK